MCLNGIGRDWSKPLVVTHEWLYEIERFKRQATTRSGLDTKLLEFIMSSLEMLPGFVDNVKETLIKYGHDLTDHWDDWVRGILEARFMFADDHISISWNARDFSRPDVNDQLTRMISSQIPGVLATITPESPGWLHQLSGLQDEVKDMLSSRDDFVNVPVIVLELGPSHAFWKGTFEVMGE